MEAKRALEDVVRVSGFQHEWFFANGIRAAEALSHVSDDTDVEADLLVLEFRAGDRTIKLGMDSNLVAGPGYVVRKESIPGRRFGAGVAVDPRTYYYIPPNIDGLVSDLTSGKYCVLCGPRQSGKTTMVMAARRKLRATVVYLDGLLSARGSWSSHELWGYLHDSLHAKCPGLFPTSRNKQEICTDVDFRLLFSKDRLLLPVILVLDEADTLLHLSAQVIAEFFAVVRSMKNDRGGVDSGGSPYNLFAFLLVGVETVRDLIEGRYDKRVRDCLGNGREYQPGNTPSRHSPFPHDHVIKSERFTSQEVQSLLEQAAADLPDVAIEVQAIATSIFVYTAGHKGLTGTCLAYVIQEQLWTFRAWLEKVESYLLGAHVFSMDTYSRILSFIRSQESIPQAADVVTEFLAVEAVQCSAARVLELREFIANGVLESSPADGDDSSYVRMSTPLLRTAILRRCTITCDQVDSPPCGSRLHHAWLTLQAVRTLDGETMTRPDCSEYMHQFLFLCRVKAILHQAYPTIGAKVLFEVKEEIVEGKQRSQLRCDALIRDGDGFSKFAFEFLANGSVAQIIEHLNRARVYHDQHSAKVYAVNFCMERSDEHLVIPKHDKLVFVSVNFSPSTESVMVTFVDSTGHHDAYEASLKSWTGSISFRTLC